MRSYPDPTKASITPMMHYLCDTFMRITFDNNPDPQMLNIDVIGELGGRLIQQSIAIAPVQSIGQPYPLYANNTAFNENKVCPDYNTVSGFK
ncbi:MAG: hypothetical protein EZS28_029434 [Streblomastix strix]|uniref:Uncharacterized protein n=1 Tax=Streblomastix strix TaxID=222440 RepID=A0A5J4UXX5_9EUKA|nr:MAG: hypothetical protein EZS28_029434 [Streblomastix strix]